MAQFTTSFFPNDSSFAPSDAAGTAAKLFLEQMRPEYPVEMRRYAAPAFITSGSDFEKFTCPRCTTLVRLSSVSEDQRHWWYTVLWQLRDENQSITVPCCGATVAARQFDFGTDAAFARFRLSVEGLGEDEQLSGEQMSALGAMLGCEVRRIIEVDG